MGLLVKSGERLHHLVKAPGQREVRHLQGAETIFGAEEHRRRRPGGERRLADTGNAMDQDARGGERGGRLQDGRDVDGHQAPSLPAGSIR